MLFLLLLLFISVLMLMFQFQAEQFLNIYASYHYLPVLLVPFLLNVFSIFEMTYTVSSGTLNPTHSLTFKCFRQQLKTFLFWKYF